MPVEVKNSTDNPALVQLAAAMHQASVWHAAQRRKGVSGDPYVNHLAEVAALVAEATGGAEPDLIIAALLHDAIEDVGVTAEMISDRFGAVVAALVVECTDDKSLPKAERKRLQVERTPHKSNGAKLIKIADKISNLRALKVSPPPDWSMPRKRDYLSWSRAVVGGARGLNLPLDAQFDRAADELEAALA